MAHLFVDDLTVIDCSVLDANRGLVGASWIVDLELTGDLDHQGMLFDFGHIKKQIKQLIDDRIDHKLVVPMADPHCVVQSKEKSTTIEFTDKQGRRFRHESPNQALCFIDIDSIRKSAVAAWLEEQIRVMLPGNVSGVTITLRMEDDQACFYHYSHGLKKHDGNCQRIAHGHRSRVEIWENGIRSGTLERYWADKWKDIYLGTRADLASNNEEKRYRFEYRAAQGQFSLELPAECVYLLDTDTTVECIAQHIAEEVFAKWPDSTIRVKAWEGVRKGAIASAAPAVSIQGK
jgi:6-pyruvoyl-tetrahydropterin synthase